MRTHGKAGTYIHQRCRCDECREAHRRHCTAQYNDRFRRTQANGGVAPVAVHGDSTYKNWGCRCVPCSDAHSVAMRNYKARVAS